MLQVFIQLIITFFIVISFGVYFASILQQSFSNPIKYLFFGFFCITILVSCWHFFLPVNQIAFFSFLAFSIIIYILKERNNINAVLNKIYLIIKLHKWIFIPSLMLTVYFSSLTSIFYDEGLYHAGYINWINKYPVVKGLANLHFRFGFNSNWHLLSALFNGYNVFKTTCNSINSTLMVGFTLFFLYEKSITNNVATALLYFPLLIIYYLIAPSADLVIYFFGLAFVVSLFNGETFEKDDSFWFYAISFLVTVKINAAILLLFFLLYCFFSFKNYLEFKKHLGGIVIFSTLSVGSWFATNLILSGYLIFPYLRLNVTHFKWLVTQADQIITLEGIKYTPLVKCTGISYEEAEKLSKLQQLILWFKHVRIVEKAIICTFLISSICLVAVTLVRKSLNRILIAIVTLLSIVFSILMVPDLRFFAGIGFATVACLISCLPIKLPIKYTKSIISFAIILQFFITIGLYIHLYPKILDSPHKSLFSFINKQPYYYSKFDTTQIDGQRVFIPARNEFSWDVTPSMLKADTSLHLLGKEMSDGFYKSNTVNKRVR